VGNESKKIYLILIIHIQIFIESGIHNEGKGEGRVRREKRGSKEGVGGLGVI
jgi:hypothetical protein